MSMSPLPQSDASVALIMPPLFLSNFNAPYLALPHLKAYLTSQGVAGVALHDANMAVWRTITTPRFLNALVDRYRAELAISTKTDAQQEIAHILLLLDYLLEDPKRLETEDAAKNQYAGVVLGLLYEAAPRNISAQIAAAETTVLEWLEAPLEKVVSELSPNTRLLGITVPTADQLFAALILARMAKARFGDRVFVALGGCIFSLLNRLKIHDVLTCGYVDAVGVHEGEQALLGLYRHVHEGAPLEDTPNIVYRDGDDIRSTSVITPPPLNACPAPEFPANFIAPYGTQARLPIWASRGCYWGKCSFCDYVHISANDGKAEVSTARHIVDVMATLGERHGVTDFELISEAIPPSLCRKISEEITARDLAVTWIAHVKVEKRFRDDLCTQMKAAGCRQVTIGVESLNDATLASMVKGCTADDAIAMLKSLNEAGIEATINIIVDFPGVTQEQAQETLERLVENRRYYSTLNVFPFVLSRLSEVATTPDDFGIKLVDAAAEEHTRGFHFTEFERSDGIDETQASQMLALYQQFGFLHKRRVSAEISAELMAGEGLDRLWIRKSELLVQVSDEMTDRLQTLDLCAPPVEGQTLIFDIHSKRMTSCPGAIHAVLSALPQGDTPLKELRAALSNDIGMERMDAFLRVVLEFATRRGLATLGLLETGGAVKMQPLMQAGRHHLDPEPANIVP